MKKYRLKLFVANNSKWIVCFFVLIILILILIVFNKFSILEEIKNLDGETIAVAGTLLGAIIGGIFTLIGSIYVNKNQLKAQTNIKKKNLIYKPLYDELMDIENEVLKSNPFPHNVMFESQPEIRSFYPQYTVWERIKTDTRLLETPNVLIEEMDKLYKSIRDYINIRNSYNKEMTEIANNILQDKIGTHCTLENIGQSLIDYFLKNENEEFDFNEKYRYCLKDNTLGSDDQWTIVNKEFNNLKVSYEGIISIKKYKNDWIFQQQKVIELLTYLIKYVNVKYEG